MEGLYEGVIKASYMKRETGKKKEEKEEEKKNKKK